MMTQESTIDSVPLHFSFLPSIFLAYPLNIWSKTYLFPNFMLPKPIQPYKYPSQALPNLYLSKIQPQPISKTHTQFFFSSKPSNPWHQQVVLLLLKLTWWGNFTRRKWRAWRILSQKMRKNSGKWEILLMKGKLQVVVSLRCSRRSIRRRIPLGDRGGAGQG